MTFILYCATIFASQFKYILSFSISGVYFSPVRILMLTLIVYDLIKQRGKIRIHKTGNNIWLITMLVWNIWTLISLFWAKERIDLIKTEVVLFEAMCFIYYAQKLITSVERSVKVIRVLLAACVIHNALGWLEITTKIYFFSRYTEKYSKLGYPVSTFTNTNNYGFYLAMMSVVLLGIIFISNKSSVRIFSTALLASSVFLLFRTGSRAAIMLTVIGIVLFALLLRKSLRFFFVTILFVLAGAVAIMAFPDLLHSLESMYQSAFKVNLNAVSGSDFYRINMIQNGMDFFWQSYGFGIGAGNVEYWMEHYGTQFTNYIYNLHNWWLEILVGSGVIVFVTVLIAWGSTYKKLIFKYIAGYRRNVICTLITFGVTFALGCISPSSLYSSEWPWLLLALFFFYSECPDLLPQPETATARKARVKFSLKKQALS